MTCGGDLTTPERGTEDLDRKSTRLNSSHRCISYAVFCLKKKKKKKKKKNKKKKKKKNKKDKKNRRQKNNEHIEQKNDEHRKKSSHINISKQRRTYTTHTR